MGKEPPIKTMAVHAILQTTADKGEITQSTKDALKHEELKVEEEIEGLRKFCHEGIISEDQMKAGIEQAQERLRQLLIENDILI